jgi:hypothetical protein
MFGRESSKLQVHTYIHVHIHVQYVCIEGYLLGTMKEEKNPGKMIARCKVPNKNCKVQGAI